MKLTESLPAFSSPHPDEGSEAGFSSVERLVVLTIIGLLMTIAVMGVRGFTGRTIESACAQDRWVVATAIESYFASHQVDRLPPLPPVDGDEFERGLVSASIIRDVSVFYDVSADGSLAPEPGSPCF